MMEIDDLDAPQAPKKTRFTALVDRGAGSLYRAVRNKKFWCAVMMIAQKQAHKNGIDPCSARESDRWPRLFRLKRRTAKKDTAALDILTDLVAEDLAAVNQQIVQRMDSHVP